MRFGNAVFNSQKYKNVKIQAEIQVLIKNENFWAIDHRKYQKQRWNQLFSYMEEVRVKTLILDYNCHSQILYQISHVSFTQLKELWLRQNNITNIQQIQLINAPSLELLRISINHIKNLQPLRKIYSKNLKEMYLPANPINSHFETGRTLLATNMNDIFLQYWQHNNTIFQDIGPIIKICSQTIHDLWIKGEERILQQKIFVMLKKRFVNVKIYRRQILTMQNQ